MEEKKDKITKAGSSVSPESKAGLKKLSEKFSLKQELVLLLRKQALGYLCPQDVVDQGGNPYVLECGCQMIAKGFDASIINIRGPEQTVIKYPSGPDELVFEYKGLSDIPYLGKVEVSGICSTRDGLFGKRDRMPKELKDISIPKVMKKALTNLRGTAIRKPLGLSNLTWADFEPHGITKENCAGVVNYGGKGSVGKPEITENDEGRLADIKRWTKEMFEGSVKLAKAYYLELTAFTPKEGKPYPGQQDPDRWSGKQIKNIHPKVKKRFGEFVQGRDQVPEQQVDADVDMSKPPYDEKK